MAGARERLLTLYSPKIDSLPYVHDTHHVTLKADGLGAPKQPGYILGFKEMALVDSERPNAKPLPIAKMMVHHFLYFARGRVDEGAGSCWRGAGFIGGRGEEHPLGRPQVTLPKSSRDVFGINNRTDDGSAPDWSLTAMVMNHYKRPKSFYVRTKVYYTTERRKSVMPVDSSDWVAPFNGRMLVASSHQHGGGKYHTLDSRTCQRRLFKAPVYHGLAKHPYNSIRPILHEPGPIGSGAYATRQGIPISAFDGNPLRDRRRLLPARQDRREGQGDDHLEVQRRPSAQRDGGQRAARVLVRLMGKRPGEQLLGDPAGQGHLQAGLPRPPDVDGADAPGQVTATKAGRRGGFRSPRRTPARPPGAGCGCSPSAAVPGPRRRRRGP